MKSLLGLLIVLFSSGAFAKTVKYELRVTRQPMNMSGLKSVDFALSVNGGIPAPTLEFTEGDDAEITVINDIPSGEEVSIHWHGLLLPPEEDGVAYVNTPPIFKGQSRTFKFRLRQSGTYWYHSHTMLQEQKGVFGALIIHPKKETIAADKEAVVVLSDWTDENPDHVLANLRKDGDYYLYKKDSVRSYFGALAAGGLGGHLKNEWSRMGGMDLSDVGYDAFLINGKRDQQLLEAHPGEKVRLRIINAAASSYFYVSLAGLPMKVISADGVDITPSLASEILIGMAETYDVLFTVPEHKNYELRATVQDVTGHASAWIGMGPRAPAPAKPAPDLYAAMDHAGHGGHAAGGGGHAGHAMPAAPVGAGAQGATDPHAGHGAAGADAHAGHAMPAPPAAAGAQGAADSHAGHAGHAMPVPSLGASARGATDPHTGHGAAVADAHAGHTMPAAPAGAGAAAAADPHAGHAGHSALAATKSPSAGEPAKDPHAGHSAPTSASSGQLAKGPNSGRGSDATATTPKRAGKAGANWHAGHATPPPTNNADPHANHAAADAHAGHAAAPASDSSGVIETLTVDSLKALAPTTLPSGKKVHEVKLVLGGDMERYVWHINGQTIAQDRTIEINEGDIVRFTMVNETMMHHPMHLHGHFFRVLNVNGESSPLKHTVDVSPHTTRTIEFYANEPGQWMLHCHNLYHMKTGMARVVKYSSWQPRPEMAAMEKHDPHAHEHLYTYTMLEAATNHARVQSKVMRTWDELELHAESRNEDGKNLSFEKKWDLEGDLLYRRWFSNYFNVMGGATLFHERGYAIAGVGYTLPMLIETAIFVNHEGKFRFDVEKRFQWTKSVFTDAELSWHPNWEGDSKTEFEVSLMYGPSWTWAAGLMATENSIGLGAQIQF